MQILRITCYQTALLRKDERNSRFIGYDCSLNKGISVWLQMVLSTPIVHKTFRFKTKPIRLAEKLESMRDGANLSDPENQVKNYLAYLALNRKVAAPTQNLAFNALLTFFRLVLNKEYLSHGLTFFLHIEKKRCF